MSLRTVIAVGCYVGLAVVLRSTYGTYHPLALGVLVGGLALFWGLVIHRDRIADSREAHTSHGFALAAVVTLFAALVTLAPLLLTAGPSILVSWIRWGTLAAAILACLLCLAIGYKRPVDRRVMLLGVGLAWAAFIAARVLTVYVAPNPGIDVFVTNTEACQYLLSGENPYTGDYTDIYDGKFGYDSAFFYWPAYLYSATASLALAGDIRFAAIVADLLSAALLVLAGRKLGLSAPVAWLLPLAWLAHPVSLLVIELAWIDPVMIAGAAGLLACLIWRQWVATGAMIGLVAATKQYGALVGLVTLAYVFSQDRKSAYRALAASAATWLALVGPYVALDWRAFYQSTIAVYITAPTRLDALSLPALFRRSFDADLPGPLLLAAYVAIVAGSCWWIARPRTNPRDAGDWAGVLAVAYGAIFLLGKQAFCNYYYLVAFFVLVYVMFALVDDVKRTVDIKSAARWPDHDGITQLT